MLPTAHQLPLCLLCLLVSLVVPNAGAAAALGPAAAPEAGRTIQMTRRNYVRDSDIDVDRWLEANKQATEVKYGMGGHTKRATGMNL